MRISFLLFICLNLLVLSGFAETPVFSFPSTIEVSANGLNCVAFSAKLEGVPAEEEENFKYSMMGPPADVHLVFDLTSKIFFWRPFLDETGSFQFEFAAEDQSGKKYSKAMTIKVLKAPSLEALPKGWEEMKKEYKYLVGRKYLPSTNFVEMDIAAIPGYELEIKVRDSMDQECVLKYIPKEGKPEVNKKQRAATIKLGAIYASGKVKKIRRDLYEDLYNSLGLIFKNIESIKLKGAYILDNFAVFDKMSLISSAGTENIYAPSLNLSFDDRFYEEAMYSKEDPMMIADSPTIKIDFNTSFGLVWRRSRLIIDDTVYEAAKGDFSLVVVKPYKDISSFDVNYVMYVLRIPAVSKLAFGEHKIVFEAENAFGMPIRQAAYARVVTLPAQIEGRPLVYPSPFNPVLQGEVKIQYKLSMQTDIEIALFGVDGSTIMRKRFHMGEAGAKKGLNTVSWDGRTEAGESVSNGIYSGIIIDRNENRILERFKIAVYR